MTLNVAVQESASLLVQIAAPALRAMVLASAAALGLVAFRVRSASIRLITWRAVLYAALAMPMLGWILPPLSLPTPGVFHSTAEVVARNIPATQTPNAQSTVPREKNSSITHTGPAEVPVAVGSLRSNSPKNFSEMTAFSAAAASSSGHIPYGIPWSGIVFAIYLAVATILLVRLAVGLILSRRLSRSSLDIDDSRVSLRLASSARGCGLNFVPRCTESEFISVPLTMGALHSTILLPTLWREWDDAKLDAVLAHEMSHVARRDALTQRLSLVHRAIFWFSPLAWWLDRHLGELAEQASDESALSSGADRNHYAKTLLEFFEALQTAPGRVWWQGVSMAKAGQAEKRLERVLAWKGTVTMSLKKPVAVMMVALAIPVVYLAASARPSGHVEHIAALGAQAQSAGSGANVTPQATVAADDAPTADMHPQSPPAPALAPVAPTTPAMTPPPAGGVVSSGPAIAPVTPESPIAPPAIWAVQSRSSRSHGRGYSYAYGYDEDQRFVIVTGKSDSLTMSGSTMDARHVERLRKQISGDFIWFQKDEESYIIRDQATIDRARKLWAPQEELGRKQEELGKQQELLGQQQEALGARMEKVQVKVPDMTAALDRLKAKLQKLGPSASMEQIDDLQSEIGELQSKIGDIQSQAGEQQGKLGDEQGALGEKQGKLGEQQGELGRQQAELAEKASHEMKQLLDEAVTKGTAQPEAKTVKTPTL